MKTSNNQQETIGKYKKSNKTDIIADIKENENVKTQSIVEINNEELILTPWQTSIISIMNKPNNRHINVICADWNDVEKRPFVCYLALNKKIVCIPAVNNKDIFERSIDICNKLNRYFIELNTQLADDIVVSICKTIEDLHFGQYITFQDKAKVCMFMEPPWIFVFVNTLGNMKQLLNKSLWAYWTVNEEDNTLISL